MTLFRKLIAPLLLGVTVAFSAMPAWAAPFQLGFALDGSGSVDSSDYDLLKSGLSSALAAIPDDGSIEITVVAYGTGVNTVVSPTILDATSLSTIQTAINNHSKDNGITNTHDAIDELTDLMTGSSLFENSDSIINLATDGLPSSPDDTETAAQNAAAAGIDALSIEAIDDGVSSPAALQSMAAIAFPDTVSTLDVNETDIPNPLDGSFVVPVSDFESLGEVIDAKVVASVTPTPVPVPGTLLLVLFGALITALRSGRIAA